MNLFKGFLAFIFSVFVVILFWCTKISIIKIYPAFVNFLFFCIFFASLFTKETVIQKIAKITTKVLDVKELSYTRNLTYVWCGFLFLNGCISFWTIFLSDEIWIFYNGFLSYVLTGFLFGVEYINRIFFKKRNCL
ncbi:hypothetical protein IJ670_08860 [bacterium]|nr:hypothetical protein [bacterium]